MHSCVETEGEMERVMRKRVVRPDLGKPQLVYSLLHFYEIITVLDIIKSYYLTDIKKWLLSSLFT